MSTHNIGFHGEISKIICDTPSYLELCNLGLWRNKKNISSFWLKKSTLSGAMNAIYWGSSSQYTQSKYCMENLQYPRYHIYPEYMDKGASSNSTDPDQMT